MASDKTRRDQGDDQREVEDGNETQDSEIGNARSIRRGPSRLVYTDPGEVEIWMTIP
jgi:hypothetical protein